MHSRYANGPADGAVRGSIDDWFCSGFTAATLTLAEVSDSRSSHHVKGPLFYSTKLSFPLMLATGLIRADTLWLPMRQER